MRGKLMHMEHALECVLECLVIIGTCTKKPKG